MIIFIAAWVVCGIAAVAGDIVRNPRRGARYYRERPWRVVRLFLLGPIALGMLVYDW